MHVDTHVEGLMKCLNHFFCAELHIDVNLVQAPELSAYKGWNKEDPVSESLIAFPFLQFKKETVKYSTNPTPYGLRVHGYSEGFFRGERVTIMKYPNISSRDIQLLRLLNHPNVVKPYLTLSR